MVVSTNETKGDINNPNMCDAKDKLLSDLVTGQWPLEKMIRDVEQKLEEESNNNDKDDYQELEKTEIIGDNKWSQWTQYIVNEIEPFLNEGKEITALYCQKFSKQCGHASTKTSSIMVEFQHSSIIWKKLFQNKEKHLQNQISQKRGTKIALQVKIGIILQEHIGVKYAQHLCIFLNNVLKKYRIQKRGLVKKNLPGMLQIQICGSDLTISITLRRKLKRSHENSKKEQRSSKYLNNENHLLTALNFTKNINFPVIQNVLIKSGTVLENQKNHFCFKYMRI